MKLYKNPFLFFLMEKSDVLVWDYWHHQQFKIDASYLQRLQFWDPVNEKRLLDSVDQDLLDEGLLQKEPFKDLDWKWDALSKIFHIGTQNIPTHESPQSREEWVKEYADECGALPSHREAAFKPEGPQIFLPPADPSLLDEKNYLTVLLGRKTNRIFSESTLSMETLSVLLFSTFGKIHGDHLEYSKNKEFVTAGLHKTSPSGGGLHPLDAYVFAFNIEGLKKGIYHYSFDQHSLTPVREGLSYEELIPLFYNQFYLENISVGVFLVADFDKCWDKYPHSRAYRIALMDTGHLSQTFLLNATALELNTWLSAAFKDKEISEILRIDGITRTPLLFVAAGEGENSALPLNVSS